MSQGRGTGEGRVMTRAEEQALVQAKAEEHRAATRPAAPGAAPPAPSQPTTVRVSARRPTPWAPLLRLASSVCGLGCAALVVWPLARAAYGNADLSLPVTGAAEKTYQPSLDEPKPGAVESDTEFNTFTLLVDSDPDKATVFVNGHEEGETPMSMEPKCTVGETLILEVRKKGFQSFVHTTHCRTERMVRVQAVLKRGH